MKRGHYWAKIQGQWGIILRTKDDRWLFHGDSLADSLIEELGFYLGRNPTECLKFIVSK